MTATAARIRSFFAVNKNIENTSSHGEASPAKAIPSTSLSVNSAASVTVSRIGTFLIRSE